MCWRGWDPSPSSGTAHNETMLAIIHSNKRSSHRLCNTVLCTSYHCFHRRGLPLCTTSTMMMLNLLLLSRRWILFPTTISLVLISFLPFAACSSLSSVSSLRSSSIKIGTSSGRRHNISVEVARLEPLFNQWMGKHNVIYGASATVADNNEYYYRLQVFYENSLIVERHNDAYNKGYTLYNMTLLNTPFADLTSEEFTTQYLMEYQNCSATTTTANEDLRSISERYYSNDHKYVHHSDDIPEHVDWRTKGIITPIKNQQHCGSCWTFSTSGTLEAHTCLAHRRHNLENNFDHPLDYGFDCTEWSGLSEQQLLDCAWNYDNHGCNGGLPSHAFEYIKSAGGLETELSYPYRANDSTICHTHENDGDDHDHGHHSHVARVVEVYNITSRDEDDLVYAIGNIGPVSVAYQVTSDFRFYSNGVYDSYNATTNTTNCLDDNQSVNHAVVAVGYGMTQPKNPKDKDFKSQPYYIIRNSWSTAWGMEGYFWILRGQNLCGISDCASFPIVPTIMPTEETKEDEKNDEVEEDSASLLSSTIA